MASESELSPLLPAEWRLLFSAPLDGATNMAVDEAILLAVANGDAPPTLRFFAWSPPCLSLGYAQPAAEADRERLRNLGWDLVRRPTGGRAILHTDELTYSVAAPLSEPRVAGGVIESYRRLSLGLLAGLGRLGVPAESRARPHRLPGARRPEWAAICFEVPSHYEITVDEKKLLGSAQVRRQGAVLQHGSLPLCGDIARICDGLHFADEAERGIAKARVHTRAITVESALQEANAGRLSGGPPSWQAAAEAITTGFAESLNLKLKVGELTEAEKKTAQQVRREKYASEEWTLKI